MDGLDETRNELLRLQGTERILFERLVESRAAIKTQKSKIDELIKQQPPVINRLSVELLSKTMFTCRKTFWRQLAAE